MTGLKFPELKQLEVIIEQFGDKARTEVIDRIHYKDHEFPIHCISLGSTEPDAPVLAFLAVFMDLKKSVLKSFCLTWKQSVNCLIGMKNYLAAWKNPDWFCSYC